MTESGICGATAKSTGDPCQRPAGWGTPSDEGRCKFHGGNSPGGEEGNANAVTHGATADPTNLYDNLGDEATEWIDSKVDAYLEGAGLSRDTPSGDLVEMAVITMFQARSGHAHLADEGIARTSIVGTSETGQPITDEEEHYLNRVVSRHSTDFRMLLKDAGVLEDPESAKAESMGSIADILSGETE